MAATNGDGPFTQQEIDDALTAVIAWAGNASAAIRYLKQQGKRAPSLRILLDWRRTKHWERYEELREEWSQKVEQTVANDMRDAARAAIEVERLAVQKAKERLEAGKDEDPARTASYLAKVAQSSTDKLMTLTSRPVTITENRNIGELVRGLVARGVLSLPPEEEAGPEPAQIEADHDSG